MVPPMSSVDDGDFKRGRFNPAAVGVGVLLLAGAATAVYFATKTSNDKLTAEQIVNVKKDIYVLPRAEQVPKWRQLADQGTFELQQEALTQLYFLEDKEAANLAAKALGSVDHRVRGMAAQVVSAIGLPDADPARAATIKAFKEADSSDRPQLAWALVSLNEKSLFKEVLDVYKSGHLAGVQRVGGGRAFDVDAFLRMASADEWAAFAGDENIGLRQLVASILAKTGDKKYTDLLIKLVNDKEIDVAREAASGLGKIGDQAALKPLLDALSRAGKDERQAFLEALRDGIGGEGLALALGSVTKETPERTKWQTKQIFDMLRMLADPRAANQLVKYLETKPNIHWQTEAALRLAEVGDVRAAGYLGDRLKLDPTKIYDKQKDPEYTRDDSERTVSARMLADLAAVHPDSLPELREKAEDGALFWTHDRPQPHANALRFLAIAGSKKFLPDLRSWSSPKDPLPKEGANGAFPPGFEVAHSALRYLGWTKDDASWSLLERQLTRKEMKLDITNEGMVGAGVSMLGMVLRGLAVGASQGYAQWGDKRAYPILLKFIEDEKQNEGAREEACRSLAWVGTDDNMKEVLTKAKAASNTDPKKQFLRACFLETLIRHPVPNVASDLLPMLTKDYDMAVRHQVARAIGWPGMDKQTEAALFEKMKDSTLMNDAALALLLGGSDEAAARAVALFGSQPPEALDDLKDIYFNSFGYWSDEDLRKGRIFRWVSNAESVGKIRVRDTLQDWAKLRLGAQFNNLEFDSGPHSMTRVVLRYRLIDLAKKGDVDAKRGAIETLKFMKEQGPLMALRDEKGDTGEMARKALFELMNPKIVTGEKVPEVKQKGGEGMNVVPPR
jgi:HEAT repeat protein